MENSLKTVPWYRRLRKYLKRIKRFTLSPLCATLYHSHVCYVSYFYYLFSVIFSLCFLGKYRQKKGLRYSELLDEAGILSFHCFLFRYKMGETVLYYC